MTLKTGEQYEESLRKLNLKIYLQGELVKNPVDHPIIRPSMNSVKATYELAQDAASVGSENSCLFPALCWYGCYQCR